MTDEGAVLDVVESFGDECGLGDVYDDAKLHSDPLRHTPLGSTSQIELHESTHAVDPLVVPGMALAADYLAALSEAATGSTGDQLAELGLLGKLCQ